MRARRFSGPVLWPRASPRKAIQATRAALQPGDRRGKRVSPLGPRPSRVLAPGIRTPACGPFRPCRRCGRPIPWHSRRDAKGRLGPEARSSYARRVYCGQACNGGAPRGNRLAREFEAVRKAARRRSLEDDGPLETPPPYGHECAVCGFPVRAGHPLHRQERPDRSGPSVITV